METFLKDVIDPAVVTLITALVAYLLNVGLPKLVDVLLKSKAATLVKAAEGLFPGEGTGTEKYQYVADALQTYAKKLLAHVKDARLKVYIEAAVTELHAELPASLGAAAKQIEDVKDEKVTSTAAAQPAQPTTTNPADQPASSEQGTATK